MVTTKLFAQTRRRLSTCYLSGSLANGIARDERREDIQLNVLVTVDCDLITNLKQIPRLETIHSVTCLIT